MIGLPANTQVWIAAGHTDMRKGSNSLAALVQTVLQGNPYCGHVFVFRGRRGDIAKVLWYDGQGLLLLAKRLERGRFVWPQASAGRVSLTPAQLSMLLEGIDWRMPVRSRDPGEAARAARGGAAGGPAADREAQAGGPAGQARQVRRELGAPQAVAAVGTAGRGTGERARTRARHGAGQAR